MIDAVETARLSGAAAKEAFPLKSKKSLSARLFPFSWRDLLITAGILLCALELCILLQMGDTSDGFASPIFVLAVLLVSRLTTGYLYGLIASVTGVVCVNYVFTSPYWAFNFTISGYPLTFLTFLAVSVITSTLTTQIKQQERLRSESEKEKMRANLLRSVSHDIRTPLTSIVGATSTLLENPGLSSEEQQTLLEDARDDAQWLIRVVENLLSITRMGDTQAHITKQPEAGGRSAGRSGAEIPQAIPRDRGRGPGPGGTADGPHGSDPGGTGTVQSAGKRSASRGQHHPYHLVCAAGRRLRPFLRSGQWRRYPRQGTAHVV